MKQVTKTPGAVIYLAIFFFATAVQAHAQNQNPVTKLYLQAATGAGTSESFDYDFGIKAIIKNKWSLGVAYTGVEMKPRNEPADYKPETGIALFIPYTYEVTTDMTVISVTCGRYFKLNRSMWSTLEAGIAYVSGENVRYTKQAQTSSGIPGFMSMSSNYSTTTEKTAGVGFPLQADINWAFTSFMGLGLGVRANLNSIQSPVGFNIKMFVGKMGKEKKQKRSTKDNR